MFASDETAVAITNKIVRAMRAKAERLLVTWCCILLLPNAGLAYSVLTHEFIIDFLWKDQITPLLLSKFPDTTPDELKEAHAYAYGGSVIQDLGYYPFGRKYFSDLSHYARTGDFVVNLLVEASNVQEYAFAVGALTHYCADLGGHPAVNNAVALTYPELAKKYGPAVTYEENHSAHLAVEFGFDVYQVAMNRFSFDDYHDFIGFIAFLNDLQIGRELDLKDLNADTGAATKRGEYGLADKTYSKLLAQLAEDHFACVTPELRENILLFYGNSSASNRTTNNKNSKTTAGARERLLVRPVSPGMEELCNARLTDSLPAP